MRHSIIKALYCIFVVCLNCISVMALTILKGPYLQSVSDSSITICWTTDSAVSGIVEYGPDALYGLQQASITKLWRGETLHEVKIEGLTSETTYHYRVTSGNAASMDATFSTAPNPGTSFKFAVYGDTHAGGDLTKFYGHQTVVNSVRSKNVDLCIITGDLVDYGDSVRYWQEFFDKEKENLKDTPLMPCWGNHDMYGGTAALDYLDNYYNYFVLPSENPDFEKYYSYDYGNVHFVSLGAKKMPEATQRNWLANDLSKANQNPAIDWIISYFHNPESRDASGAGFSPILYQYNVDISFDAHLNGEYHVNGIINYDSVVYVTSGQGSINPAYCLIEINDKQLTLRNYNAATGAVIDSFTLLSPRKKDRPSVPAIALTPASLTFSAEAGSANPTAQIINVTNSGGDTLADITTSIVYGVGEPQGWLNLTLSGTGNSQQISNQPMIGSLCVGAYHATVTVNSTGASNTPRTYTVTFNITTNIPAITLSQASLTFNATVEGGNPSDQTIDVTNTGGGTLADVSTTITYGNGQPTGWLTIGIIGIGNAQHLVNTASTASINAGTYTATISVTSTGASNTPQTYSVTFSVNQASGVTPLSGKINIVKQDIKGLFNGAYTITGRKISGDRDRLPAGGIYFKKGQKVNRLK